MTNDPPLRPIVPPAREDHRRKFSAADKCRIGDEAAQSGASLSVVARRYGIAVRVPFGWKQELAATTPVFFAVQITDVDAPSSAATSAEGHVS
jgi:transposase-like protein